MDRALSSFPPIGLAAYSDLYAVPSPKVWGDYWLKENLTQEFLRLGYPVDHANPKILLHLFGEPRETIPPGVYPILWIHSHPDWITPAVLKDYRKIFCISKQFIGKIKEMGCSADLLMVPTKMSPVPAEKKYDIVFVGNTRHKKMRKIIADLGTPPCRIKIWGSGWEGLIPDEWYGGEYYEHDRLGELYASARIVLNDHHDDMRREGFINPRILDVLASGGFVVSDRVVGIDELLKNSVAVYDTPLELREIIARYLNDEQARHTMSLRGQKVALQYSYAAACKKIIDHIKSLSDTVSL